MLHITRFLASQIAMGFHSQFLNQNFHFFSRIHVPLLSLLRLEKQFCAFMPVGFSNLLLWVTAHLFPVSVSLAAKSVLSCRMQVQAELGNFPELLLEGASTYWRKINPYLIRFLLFPLSIFYWPLEWGKRPVQGAVHIRTRLRYQSLLVFHVPK